MAQFGVFSKPDMVAGAQMMAGDSAPIRSMLYDQFTGKGSREMTAPEAEMISRLDFFQSLINPKADMPLPPKPTTSAPRPPMAPAPAAASSSWVDGLPPKPTRKAPRLANVLKSHPWPDKK